MIGPENNLHQFRAILYLNISIDFTLIEFLKRKPSVIGIKNQTHWVRQITFVSIWYQKFPQGTNQFVFLFGWLNITSELQIILSFLDVNMNLWIYM